MAVKKPSRRRERRTSTRADARLSMRVEGGHVDGGTAQVVTESQNISSSGVYCLSSHYLSPLSKVQLTIVLPKLPGAKAAQELIKCEGIVVRCESTPSRRGDPHYQLACMFSDLEGQRRSRLEEFVAWRNLQALRDATRPARRAKPAAAARSGRSAAAARRPAAGRASTRRNAPRDARAAASPRRAGRSA